MRQHLTFGRLLALLGLLMLASGCASRREVEGLLADVQRMRSSLDRLEQHQTAQVDHLGQHGRGRDRRGLDGEASGQLRPQLFDRHPGIDAMDGLDAELVGDQLVDECEGELGCGVGATGRGTNLVPVAARD